RIEYATPGNKQAWYDTFVSQQHLAKFSAVYPKRVDDLESGGSTTGSSTVSGSETGSLAGGDYAKICQHGIPADTRRTSMEPVTSDLHYCPVTGFIGDYFLGYELNPLCYPILFDQIKIQVDKFFYSNGQVICSEQITQFIDNVIVIMRSLFEMKSQQYLYQVIIQNSSPSVVGGSSNDPSSNSPSTSGHGGPQQINENPLANVNILEQLVLNIVRYARHLDTSVGAVAIRTRVCQLVESMIKRRDDLSFRQEIKFRNKLVHVLGQTAVGVGVGVGVNVTTSQLVVDQYQHLTRELDQVSMEAVASLLHSLPLQPEESDRGDLMEAKSQLFLKYFTLFMNLLNDCSNDLNDDQNSLSDYHHQTNNERTTTNINNQTQFINQLQQKQQSLRNSTIVAMSNLLTANIESGLMRSIALGYHRDPQTRAAFMEVLTKILQQGTEFDTLAETVLADHFERLVELVTMIEDKGELPFAMALANVVSPQYMITFFFHFLYFT
ncbi:unnamed protein product, partial [Rotaria sp. Silwood2]